MRIVVNVLECSCAKQGTGNAIIWELLEEHLHWYIAYEEGFAGNLLSLLLLCMQIESNQPLLLLSLTLFEPI